MDTFVDNLPGFPDNIRPSSTGGYWVAMSAVRPNPGFSMLDFLSQRPWIKKLIFKVNSPPDQPISVKHVCVASCHHSSMRVSGSLTHSNLSTCVISETGSKETLKFNYKNPDWTYLMMSVMMSRPDPLKDATAHLISVVFIPRSSPLLCDSLYSTSSSSFPSSPPALQSRGADEVRPPLQPRGGAA